MLSPLDKIKPLAMLLNPLAMLIPQQKTELITLINNNLSSKLK